MTGAVAVIFATALFGVNPVGSRVSEAQSPSDGSGSATPRPSATIVRGTPAVTATSTLTSSQGNGRILLSPFAGPSANPVTANGRNWQPGDQVILYLEDDDLEYAVASTAVDKQGEFTVSFFIPSYFADEAVIIILARDLVNNTSAQAFYNITDVAPTVPATPEIQAPRGEVTVNRLNVRTGPGTVYRVIGQVELDQTLEINGVNSGWWRINFPHASGDFGWVFGAFVAAENTDEAPFIQAPPTPIPPPTPTPTPTPPAPVFECNPGQWSGCGGASCAPDHVSQCQDNGQWGQCVWDPGHCGHLTGGGGAAVSDDDDDDDDFGDDTITQEDVDRWLRGERPEPDDDDDDDDN